MALRRRFYKAIILRRDEDKHPDDDFSVAAVQRLLLEMVELSDQQTAGPPVIELLIGDILTRTALASGGAEHWLSITALLQTAEQPGYSPHPPAPGADQRLMSIDFLWHADEGRYIVVRKVPLQELRDEPDVMDAILTTADMARGYFAAACAGQSPS